MEHISIKNLPDFDIIKMYKSGKSARSIAEAYNVTHTTIIRHLKRNGIIILSKSEILRGKNNPMYGKRGELSSLWCGGKSFEPYGIEFNKELKEQIRKRDNFTCQECDINQKQLGYKLSIHHIDFNKKNNSVDNLISLCKSCHSQTNYNRENWTKYYVDKLNGVIS